MLLSLDVHVVQKVLWAGIHRDWRACRTLSNNRKKAGRPGESFFGTSAEITFQHRNRRILKFLLKTNTIADNFQFCRNGVFMGCAYL